MLWSTLSLVKMMTWYQPSAEELAISTIIWISMAQIRTFTFSHRSADVLWSLMDWYLLHLIPFTTDTTSNQQCQRTKVKPLHYTFKVNVSVMLFYVDFFTNGNLIHFSVTSTNNANTEWTASEYKKDRANFVVYLHDFYLKSSISIKCCIF